MHTFKLSSLALETPYLGIYVLISYLRQNSRNFKTIISRKIKSQTSRSTVYGIWWKLLRLLLLILCEFSMICLFNSRSIASGNFGKAFHFPLFQFPRWYILKPIASLHNNTSTMYNLFITVYFQFISVKALEQLYSNIESSFCTCWKVIFHPQINFPIE